MKIATHAAILITGGTILSNGISDEARYVVDQTDEGRIQLQNSFALGSNRNAAMESLYQVAMDCRNHNWDGYGAEPVLFDTCCTAFGFLKALPLGCPSPTIGAEPDGHVTFEWYNSPQCVLSVSLSPTGELNYAALLAGSRKANGVEQFVVEIPSRILSLVGDVISA